MLLLHIFQRVILPVFIVIGMSYVYTRRNTVDVRPFAHLAWNLTGPCLAFSSLATTTMPDDDVVRIILFVWLMTFALWPVAILAAHWLRLDRQVSSAFQLSVLFGNVVNYGFPVLLFAFGDAGVERGIVIMAGNQFMLGGLAVFIASRGHGDWRHSLANVLKVPMLYAAVLGFLVNRFDIVIPKLIFEPIHLVGQINVMFMLIILGMQLAQAKLEDGRKALALSVVLRLVGGVIVGAIVAQVLGLQGLTRQAAIVEAGTPAAVYSAIIAAEYDTAPSFVAASILLSTLASMVTLTIVLALLGVH